MDNNSYDFGGLDDWIADAIHSGVSADTIYKEVVGSEELNNLELAQIIAEAQGKELNYEMVDFHSSRPGHDLRYALSGDKMRELGWTPAKSVRDRIAQVTKWTLENERWIKL